MNHEQCQEILDQNKECIKPICKALRWQADEIERLKADLEQYMQAANYEANRSTDLGLRIAELESGKPRWVACSERMPPLDGPYWEGFVELSTVGVVLAEYVALGFCDPNKEDFYPLPETVTHWLEFDIPPVPAQTGE